MKCAPCLFQFQKQANNMTRPHNMDIYRLKWLNCLAFAIASFNFLSLNAFLFNDKVSVCVKVFGHISSGFCQTVLKNAS